MLAETASHLLKFPSKTIKFRQILLEEFKLPNFLTLHLLKTLHTVGLLSVNCTLCIVLVNQNKNSVVYHLLASTYQYISWGHRRMARKLGWVWSCCLRSDPGWMFPGLGSAAGQGADLLRGWWRWLPSLWPGHCQVPCRSWYTLAAARVWWDTSSVTLQVKSISCW